MTASSSKDQPTELGGINLSPKSETHSSRQPNVPFQQFIDGEQFIQDSENFDVGEYFPYDEARPQQKAIVKMISENLDRKAHLIIEAANGVGKTISTLAPTIEYVRSVNKDRSYLRKLMTTKSYEDNEEFDQLILEMNHTQGIDYQEDLKVLYLTRTHDQGNRVIEELLEFRPHLNITGIAKRGRQDLCIEPLAKKLNGKMFSKFCQSLKNKNKCKAYENVKKNKKDVESIIEDIVALPIDSPEIKEMADSKGFCPAEITNYASAEVEVVTGSYLYLLEPNFRHSFISTMNTEAKNLVVIIDECHNLPDTTNGIGQYKFNHITLINAKQEASSQKNIPFISNFLHDFGEILQDYSAQLFRNDDKELEIYKAKLFFDLITITKDLRSMIEDYVGQFRKGVHVIFDDPEDYLDQILQIITNIGSSVIRKKINNSINSSGSIKIAPYSALHIIGTFLTELWDEVDSESTMLLIKNEMTYEEQDYSYRNKLQEFSLEITPLDPQIIIKPILSEVFATVSISGSLGPKAFDYRVTTGLNFLNRIVLELPSPYDPNNILVMVIKELSSEYKRRSPSMFRKMGTIVAHITDKIGKNIGMFAPSYHILNEINKSIKTNKKKYIIDKSYSKKAAEKAVEEFKTQHKKGALLGSVQGGRISEGSDFPGPAMSISIITGIAYPPLDIKTKKQIELFNSRIPHSGRDLMYTNPAYRKASQAAGRCVRSLQDRSIIIFMDDRVLSNKHRLPRWLQNYEVLQADKTVILRRIKKFVDIKQIDQ